MRHNLYFRTIGIATLTFAMGAAGQEQPQSAAVNDFSEAARWLQDTSRQLIRDSRRRMDDGVAAFPPQAGAGYEAFWLRDYAYMLEGCPEAFSEQELRDACRLFVNSLRSDGAAVDCVRFSGAACYQPGYGTMGANPVADGGMFMIDMAWHTHQRLKDRAFLGQIIDRLLAAIQSAPRNPKTGLVSIDPKGYDRCPYGFTDSVRKQGDELFCSLLLIQADRQLAGLLTDLDRNAEAKRCLEDERRLVEAVRQVFWDDQTGLFLAATLKCKQPDIWGSAFAVYLSVASKEQASHIAHYFDQHYAELVQAGQLRHLLDGQYWEEACPKDYYQNGGYWATPIGWFVVALHEANPKLAQQTVIDLVRDFQAYGSAEWVLGKHRAVPNYLSSVTMPLVGIRRLQAASSAP
ncbi:MAG: hypothetical protein IT427_04780 [Pirellulales bacterium]|nr:hypothetical protein [Pirellulales bacterium]